MLLKFHKFKFKPKNMIVYYMHSEIKTPNETNDPKQTNANIVKEEEIQQEIFVQPIENNPKVTRKHQIVEETEETETEPQHEADNRSIQNVYDKIRNNYKEFCDKNKYEPVKQINAENQSKILHEPSETEKLLTSGLLPKANYEYALPQIIDNGLMVFSTQAKELAERAGLQIKESEEVTKETKHIIKSLDDLYKSLSWKEKLSNLTKYGAATVAVLSIIFVMIKYRAIPDLISPVIKAFTDSSSVIPKPSAESVSKGASNVTTAILESPTGILGIAITIVGVSVVMGFLSGTLTVLRYIKK